MGIIERTLYDNDAFLDLQDGVGIRTATFEFPLIDGVTGENKGFITPLLGASLSHDTASTIKRRLNFGLGVVDTATIDTVSDRVLVNMLINGVRWPLGRYMFTNKASQFFSAGRLSNVSLVDEMFLVDQPIEKGINGLGKLVSTVISETVADLPVVLDNVEESVFTSVESWGIGTNRGNVLSSLSVTGDYFSPWFGNDTKLHFIRSFNPADAEPDFDYDIGNQVFRAGIVETDELLTAPNRVIVVSNSANDPKNPVVGIADIAPNAPNSIQNRGFVVPKVFNLQVGDLVQANFVATGLAQRLTVFEQVSLSTAPDPRHDSYNVISWQGEKWLELSWSMNLLEGGAMTHILRKSYTA